MTTRRKNIKRRRQLNKAKHFSYPSEKKTTSYMQDKPAFSFEFLQSGHCITLCDERDRLSFIDNMRILSQMTWQQIRNAPRHGLGSEKINRDSFKVKIPNWVTDDITFIAIRFSGLKPMVGYQSGRIFQVVWFDRDFDVYDHGND